MLRATRTPASLRRDNSTPNRSFQGYGYRTPGLVTMRSGMQVSTVIAWMENPYLSEGKMIKMKDES